MIPLNVMNNEERLVVMKHLRFLLGANQSPTVIAKGLGITKSAFERFLLESGYKIAYGLVLLDDYDKHKANITLNYNMVKSNMGYAKLRQQLKAKDREKIKNFMHKQKNFRRA